MRLSEPRTDAHEVLSTGKNGGSRQIRQKLAKSLNNNELCGGEQGIRTLGVLRMFNALHKHRAQIVSRRVVSFYLGIRLNAHEGLSSHSNHVPVKL
jgi:hypothetical protein